MSGLKMLRYGAWAAVVLVIAAVAFVTVNHYREAGGGGSFSPVASIGGPFTMTDAAAGKTVTEADFEGTPYAFFFVFTFCPDVCSTTLAEAQGWIEELGADADKIDFAFTNRRQCITPLCRRKRTSKTKPSDSTLSQNCFDCLPVLTDQNFCRTHQCGLMSGGNRPIEIVKGGQVLTDILV